MDPAKFQQEARDAAQLVHAAALARLYDVALQPNLDPELALKLVRETKDIAQALPKDKNDAYANLPVFNIIFGAGMIPTVVQTVPSVEQVQEAFGVVDALPAPDFNLEFAEPTAAMAGATRINMEVVDGSSPSDISDSFDALEALR